MWLTRTSIAQPVFATMVMVGLMVLGLFSYQRLGVEPMPDVQMPMMTIQVAYPGASPEIVENDITKPIEEAVNTISGIDFLASSSYEGRSVTWIGLTLQADVDRAMQELRDKMAQLRPQFPREAKDPQILRQQENAEPVATLTVSSASVDPRQLSTLTEQLIVKRLRGVAGVGTIEVSGQTSRRIQIQLRPERMKAQAVGVNEVIRAVQNRNQDVPAGAVSGAVTEQLVRVEGKVKEPSAFGKIIVARRANAPVYLEQVADVVDGEQEARSVARSNGQPAISLSLTKTQDANIVETGKGIAAAVDKLKAGLPPGVELAIVRSSSEAVERQLDNVKHMIIEGAALTVLIVFLFLQSWRSTVITALTLPIAVLATFIAMRLFGFTLNSMTLMALALCIGLLIDDAIVVRENIVRHLAMGKSHVRAALDGTQEIGLAVMATTFAIVAVFVPVAFMDGMIGRYFLQFGLTVSVAVLISLFVSFTLDPMLSSVWPDPEQDRFARLPWLGRWLAAFERGLDALHRAYDRLLRRALAWRKSTLGLALALFIGALLLLPTVGSEMQPQTDQGYITLGFKTPVGSSLVYTDGKLRQVEQALKEIPAIERVVATAGGENGVNSALLTLTLVPRQVAARPSQQVLEQQIRAKLQEIAGIDISLGWGKPIRVDILGQDADTLEATARQVMAKMAAIKGITDLEYSQTAENPAIGIHIKQEVASDLGLSPEQIGATLRPLLSGDPIGRWLGPDGQNYDISVQLPKHLRQDAGDLADLALAAGLPGPLGTPLGISQSAPVMVPLRQIADFRPAYSPQVIGRQFMQRRVGIYANVQGRPAGDVGQEVQAMTRAIALPPGVQFDLGGGMKQMREMQQAASVALAIAVIFIYLVLASQFASFLQPLAIMSSLSLSLIGVVLALLATGSTLNVFSVIGFIMLMGLVTKNAILLVDFSNQAQREGMGQHEALLHAGQVRLRPILMTTLAMIFGMLPMAIGAGEGGEIQAPMGRAVIGGVLTSTLLTLVVVPVAYSYLDTWGRRARRYFQQAHAAPGGAPETAAPEVARKELPLA
ncbi:efflux RND transporter permease subunit [Pseudoduganella violacea]|uniref:Hydrophobe/amphiphile efflux-1 (HAE1) family protein n=1 Tax=Pseudoduganella violacea TaxID=1715466 RepID=A0A7W5B6R2_9BURK|nr:efflux RND transporter permease subunit [Pseudoduganella violacea]MBB3117572.1 hydrophobe/amphiphile efflux-1 (HAE1) family protein [Pseudoduganella violacea]